MSTMNNCAWVRQQASLLIYGELSMEDEELLEAHAAGCADCRQAIAAERRLHAVLDDDAGQEPLPASLLVESRRALQLSLAQEKARRQSVWGRLSSFFAADAWVWKPVFACALVAVGFYGSKWQTQREIMQRMASAPAGELRLVRTTADGQVEIAYETPQRHVVRGRMDDAAIRGLLMRAAREADDATTRVRTVEALQAQAEQTEVRQALLAVAQRDPSVEVRATAVGALKEYAGEMATRRGLMEVVRRDADTGVRSRAIDLILLHTAPSRFDADMIGTLQETMQREDNGYVRQRCEKALTLVKASPIF
jgi:hypothetical protein